MGKIISKPPIHHKISTDETGNSTKVLLAGGATFTGAWENITDWNTVGVAIIGTNITDGTLYIESSQDGGITVNSVPYTVANTTFDLPKVWNVIESHIRVRYVNGSTAQTGQFQIQTKYSNGQELGVLHSMGDQINDNLTGNLVKSVNTGSDPNGTYINTPAPGIDNNNSTSTPLGIGTTFTGDWTRVDLYSEIKIAYDADVDDANCYLQLSANGVDVHTSLSVPPHLKPTGVWGGIHTLNPSLPYFRVVYENGAIAQTDFTLTVLLLVTSGNGFITRSTDTINKHSDIRLQRVINSPEQDRNFGYVDYQEAKRKFGTNEVVGNSFETIAPDGAGIVFPSVNETIRVRVGGNAADTNGGLGAQSVFIQILDENGIESEIELVTAGASASAASTKLVSAINRARTKGTNTGIITIENTTTNEVLAVIEAGFGTTRQCMFTVRAGSTAWITKIYPAVGDGDSADVQLSRIRDIAGVSSKHYDWGVPGFIGVETIGRTTFLKYEEGERIIGEAKKVSGGGGGARVGLDFDIILTENS